MPHLWPRYTLDVIHNAKKFPHQSSEQADFPRHIHVATTANEPHTVPALACIRAYTNISFIFRAFFLDVSFPFVIVSILRIQHKSKNQALALFGVFELLSLQLYVVFLPIFACVSTICTHRSSFVVAAARLVVGL